MKIELFYFDDCPSYEHALRNLTDALAAERLEEHVEMVPVLSEADAEAKRFLGSPTIRARDGTPRIPSVSSIAHLGFQRPRTKVVKMSMNARRYWVERWREDVQDSGLFAYRAWPGLALRNWDALDELLKPSRTLHIPEKLSSER